jgi:multidrug resistance protein, MATE family
MTDLETGVSSGNEDHEQEGDEHEISKEKDVEIAESFFQMFVAMFTKSLPISLTMLLGIFANFILLYFAGHLPNDPNPIDTFSGISMCILFSQISCRSIFMGLSGAIETLGSQHYGSKNYVEVGITLQRSFLILGLLTIPIMICWSFVEEIFLSIGVSSSICKVMKIFFQIRIFALPSDVIGISYQKYVLAIGVTSPSLIGTISLIFLVTVFNLFFLKYLQMGDPAVLAWGFVISRYLSDIAMILSSWTEQPVRETLQPLSWKAFNNWGEFLKLGLPGCLMLCSEWWAFEILSIFASQLGNNEIAAQSIIGELCYFACMLPLGLSIAASSLVGQSLGSHRPDLGLRLAGVAFFCLLLVELLICPMIFFYSVSFIRLFTTDSDVIHLCLRVSVVITIFSVVDGIQGVASGILRGAGKQSYGAVNNIVSHYLLGLPLAWYLAFHTSLRVTGLMIGFTSALALQSVIYVTLLIYFQNTIFAPVVKYQMLEMKETNS